MELLLQQVLAGLATGAIYASMALAVVMIYQAIDHLNFAQGEMAMFSTFLAWQMLQWGWPYWAAFVGAVAVSFLGGVAIERVLFKPIQNAPILSQLAAFIALYGILNSSAGWIWDFNIKTFPTPFGSAPLFGERLISTHQAGMIGVTLLMLGLLYLFFRGSRLGLAMRAAATNPESARLVGIRVGWMIALGWGMSAAVAARHCDCKAEYPACSDCGDNSRRVGHTLCPQELLRFPADAGDGVRIGHPGSQSADRL